MPKSNFLARIQQQLRKYNLLRQQSESVKTPKSKAAQETTFALSQLAAAVISSLIASGLLAK